jgi:coatomer subunit beta
VILNEIHIDIINYIKPATCGEVEFRQMWAEFEWENKVAVATNMRFNGDGRCLLAGTLWAT